jgi:hypothetical protein
LCDVEEIIFCVIEETRGRGNRGEERRREERCEI